MPVINRGDDYFQAITYTGNGSTQTISGLRFQPDFVWIKGRSGATDHALYDAQRGVQKRLESNTTDAEASSDNGVTAFTSDGFTLGSLAQVNTNGATYVAWCWKESASAGFDIVTYTGTGSNRTEAHSLGVAPAMMLCKTRSGGVENWYVWHKSIPGSTPYMYLNLTNAAVTGDATRWTAAPTSTVINLGSNSATNGSGYTYVTYLFAEVAGFSKFGSYTGNGSADGPFVFCGFRPRFILVKRTDSSTYGNWEMIDTARDTYNQAYLDLSANLSAAENATDGAAWDILSNGFKCRDGSSTGNKNVSGATYIYAAFAEHPFKNSLAR